MSYPSRLTPWRQVGKSVSGTRNAHEALAAAGLAGWNIRKLAQRGIEPSSDGGVVSVMNPEQVMLVRNDPFTGAVQYLSTVGRTYGLKQNEDSADVIDALVGESGAEGLAEAGQLEGGRRTFVTMRLPQTMLVAGIDPIELHLVVFNAHDGSASFRVMLVPYRIWCANQLPVAIKDKVRSVAIRHTSKSAINVAEIRSQLGLMYEYAEAFEKQAARMLNAQMTNDEFGELVETVWPVDGKTATSRTLNNARRRRGQLVRLWTSAETQAPIRGSRWAAFQAVTEYLDHYSPAKNVRVRANRVLTSDDLAKKKQTAYDLLAV